MPRSTTTTAASTPRRTARTKLAQPTLALDKRLVLNQWLLSLFGCDAFEKLADTLKDPAFEGYTADNNTNFLRLLQALPRRHASLSADMLLAYDEHIVRHWKQIVDRREQAGTSLFMKYFQYLTLLFTEIYLDRWFSDRAALRDALNDHVAQFNADKSAGDQVARYADDDLKKIAFWNATGSGKTLLMHVNILQYQQYLAAHGQARDLNRIILLTPNAGLSQQHLEEFGRSGMDAELFRKDGGRLFTSQSIEIIDIHKLRDESGDKTVAVDAFEGNNLVLVDEGHRGAGGEDWMGKRQTLSEDGFSFEYSATFGQAMRAAKDAALTETYARCILFDYSYKYFYRDGYGKDYAIHNLKDDSQEATRLLYLTGGLLTFYQQRRLFGDQHAAFQPYLLEAPLLVFVGGSVTKATTKRDVSDVMDILLFLANVVHPDNRAAVLRRIAQLIEGKASLLDKAGHELFANAFSYLHSQKLTAEDVYTDMLRQVFGAAAAGMLHVENLKAGGEIALRVGTNEPFGVINIGDAATLIKQCQEQAALVVSEPEFSGSLFGRINTNDSPITVLVGSKKFTEGWSSWRVSTMGLMSIGQSEGSQIIQLFGRGVRLKGYGFGLKRSRLVAQEQRMTAPRFIEELETLNIFGVRADYMDEFRQYLEDEGVSTTPRVSLTLPTVQLFKDTLPALRVIAVKDGIDFKKYGPKPTIGRLTDARLRTVPADWYPKIDSRRSNGAQRGGDAIEKHSATLTPQHLAFMDFDAIYFELLRYKAEKGWHNLNLTRQGIQELLAHPDWYALAIPPEALAFTGMKRVRLWQEIAVTLLKKYCDAFYKYKKSEYELPYLEYRDLDPAGQDAGNVVDSYEFQIDTTETDLIAKLEGYKDEIEAIKKLGTEITAGMLKPLEVTQNNFKALIYMRHLYQPLIYLKSDCVAVKPVALNAGERDFVEDLCAFHEGHAGFFADTELYLLRNQSRGKGIGFFEAGNFYPDFILWLLRGTTQYVTFLDPKGIRNLDGPDDPKISFFQTIKELERRLGEPHIVLNSFIIANTPHTQVQHWRDATGAFMDIAAFKQRNVFFQQEDRKHYIQQILERVLADAPISV